MINPSDARSARPTIQLGEKPTGSKKIKMNPKRTSQFFLVIGLFVSIGLDIVKNVFAPPSWMIPLIPFFLFALVALLILVETIKEEIPPISGRRAFLNRFILPASTISLLTFLGGFLTIKEADVDQERAKLEKEQQAFDAQRKSQLTKLRIGFLPISDSTDGTLSPNIFNDGLTTILGIPVTSGSIGKTYKETVKALGEGAIEVAWLGPLSYLYAHQQYGAKVILRQLSPQGLKSYHSYIITKKDSGFRTLQDLKGQVIAFVDPDSTSGNLIPRYEFQKAQIDPNNGIKSYYAESHANVIQAVLNGDAVAGAVASDNYEIDPHKADLTILFASQVDIPEGAVAVRKDIQLYDALRIEDAFLTIGESPTVLRSVPVFGFAKATDETYQDLLSIAREMGVDLSTYNG